MALRLALKTISRSSSSICARAFATSVPQVQKTVASEVASTFKRPVPVSFGNPKPTVTVAEMKKDEKDKEDKEEDKRDIAKGFCVGMPFEVFDDEEYVRSCKP